VDGAAFLLAVGAGGLLHRHGSVHAQPESAVGQQGDRLIQRAGSTFLGRLRSVTPKSAAAGSDKVMTHPGPPAKATASARTPWPAAANGVHRA
jgi:hypothetical protein